MISSTVDVQIQVLRLPLCIDHFFLYVERVTWNFYTSPFKHTIIQVGKELDGVVIVCQAHNMMDVTPQVEFIQSQYSTKDRFVKQRIGWMLHHRQSSSNQSSNKDRVVKHRIGWMLHHRQSSSNQSSNTDRVVKHRIGWMSHHRQSSYNQSSTKDRFFKQRIGWMSHHRQSSSNQSSTKDRVVKHRIG